MRNRTDPWGYKGKETALNGLQNFLDNKLGHKGRGKANDRWLANCRIIEQIGKQLFPDLNLKGKHLEIKARLIAKRVQGGHYNSFVEAFKTYHINLLNTQS